MLNRSNYLPLQAMMATGVPNDNGLPYSGNYFTDMNGNVIQGGDHSSSYNYIPPVNPNAEDQRGAYNLKPEIAMPQEFLSRFGSAMPTGAMTLEQLVQYTGGERNGFTPEKFGMLNPNTQKGILSDPATFLKGQMGFGPQVVSHNTPGLRLSDYASAKAAENPNAKYTVPQGQGGSRALLDFGVQGGSRDLSKLYWDPTVGLVQDPSNYMNIQEDFDWAGTLGVLAIGAMTGGAGLAAGMSAGGAGALAGGAVGAVNGFNSSPDGNFGDVLKGGAKGAAMGYAGGTAGDYINKAVGYNPTIADATWSAGATPFSSWAVNAGKGYLQNAFKGLVGTGVNSLFGSGNGGKAPTGYSSQSNGGYTSSNNTTGGNNGMSIFDNINLNDLTGLLSGGADALMTGSQRRGLDAAYGKANDLILNPSAEQGQIRAKTMGMINDPGSFFQDPLYQAAFGQGQQALERSQAAKGMAGSGGAATELQKYGQTFGADMYTQRLGQLANLSGIQMDPASRQMGAKTLIEGALGDQQLKGDQLRAVTSGINRGFGSAGNPNSLGNTSLSQMFNGVKDIFNSGKNLLSTNNIPSWTPGDYSEFNSSIDTNMSSWDNYLNHNTDWFGGSGSAGSTLQDMMGSSASGGSDVSNFANWSLY